MNSSDTVETIPAKLTEVVQKPTTHDEKLLNGLPKVKGRGQGGAMKFTVSPVNCTLLKL